MLHLLIHKYNRQNTRGFTLVEMLAIIIIVGILCAIAAPSLLAMQGVAKLNSSADNIRTALETSQFQAVKKHTRCQVYIPTNSSTISGDCLPLFNLDPGITVRTSGLTGTPPQAIYNLQGLTQSSGTIILSSNETGDKRCLILNKGVGLIRGGKYINNTTCQVTE
jgi:prepilin-type N-terminal cleavage/methylation domain-containing protein